MDDEVPNATTRAAMAEAEAVIENRVARFDGGYGMTPNISELIKQGRVGEAEALLNQKFELSAAVGERSTRVALEAATQLFDGNLRATIFWMNQRMYGSDDTPLQAAERSVEDMESVLDRIGQIEAGVYV